VDFIEFQRFEFAFGACGAALREISATAMPEPIGHAGVLGPIKAKPFGLPRQARPALTGPVRGGLARCGRDGRMLAARVEQKNAGLGRERGNR